MSSRKQLVELCAKFVSLTKRQMRTASLHRIVMLCGAASMLLAVTTATGRAAELTSLGSQTPSLDALAYDAISESVLWSFAGPPDDGNDPNAGLIADKWGNFYSTTGGGANSDGTIFELSLP